MQWIERIIVDVESSAQIEGSVRNGLGSFSVADTKHR